MSTVTASGIKIGLVGIMRLSKKTADENIADHSVRLMNTGVVWRQSEIID